MPPGWWAWDISGVGTNGVTSAANVWGCVLTTTAASTDTIGWPGMLDGAAWGNGPGSTLSAAPPLAPAPAPRAQPKPMSQAERVAMDLLHDMLTREEWRALRRDKRITVPSKFHPTRLYVVTDRARVLVEEGGKVTGGLCFHPPNEGRLPLGDRLLARVWLLKHDEERVLEVANPHPPDGWYARGEPMFGGR